MQQDKAGMQKIKLCNNNAGAHGKYAHSVHFISEDLFWSTW